MKIQKYLDASPVFAVNKSYETFVYRVNRRLKAEDVNLLQGLVLVALLFEGDQSPNPSSLAECFKTTRGNMSHIISNLEAKGLVKRITHLKDARRFHIEIKPQGKKKALILIKYFDGLQSRLEKKLGIRNCEQMILNIQGLSEISP